MCFNDTNVNSVNNGEYGVGGVYIVPLDNAVDYQGTILQNQYTQSNGAFFWDGLMERTLYRFNLTNPADYLFGSYDISLTCPQGKVCVRDANPNEGYRGTTVIENLTAFQVPMLYKKGIAAGISTLCLKINVDLGPMPTPPPAYKGIAVVGNMFIDSSGNGLKDSNENWYAGLTIALLDRNGNTLTDANGNPVPYSTTDANGRFVFENIREGFYTIKIISGINGVYNPGTIGPFAIANKDSVASTSNDQVKSPTINYLGNYGLTPIGTSTCSGMIYIDLDFDGYFDATDKPADGIKVNIYSPIYGYLVWTTTTGSDGRWSCNGLVSTIKYRIEFVGQNIISTGPDPFNFINGSDNIQVGVSQKILNQGNQNSNNPSAFATTCFVKGSRAGTYQNDPAVVRFSANATGYAFKGDGMKYAQKLAYHNQVGSCFGITYRPETEDTYVSAFYKGSSDFGPSGMAAIYKITKGFQVSTFIDLTKFGINPGSTTHYFNDALKEGQEAGRSTCKVSLGDLKSTNRYLYVTNLYTNEVVQIPITVTPTTSNVLKKSVPNPGCTYASDWRIFALEIYQGQLYVAGVCTGESGSSLTG
ncbi:hypothetical protein PPL_09618 [Heterostelium album PN500]|uniref:SD-repeat containing protein B domain-containing protein n=1 Tax=Heterostelium pallidum (strain ATCC 26659 / Pp 5 / PN500) TaxID=670386 RepID=D3BNU7_HETP5|nr:hypothetical protein PPL_09618 [Heterostelium album PN500]EFA76866.1 hypothetical protein PPL_09618 [Heterostelium album PN500]|eukprot:XP_020428998.1 hypothetical protein PPL_09618 [Heterostelium album PN500]